LFHLPFATLIWLGSLLPYLPYDPCIFFMQNGMPGLNPNCGGTGFHGGVIAALL